MTEEFINDHLALIAVAEANWRADSYSWHVFLWMAYKLRCKYGLVARRDQIINWDLTC